MRCAPTQYIVVPSDLVTGARGDGLKTKKVVRLRTALSRTNTRKSHYFRRGNVIIADTGLDYVLIAHVNSVYQLFRRLRV